MKSNTKHTPAPDGTTTTPVTRTTRLVSERD